ncbi:RING finger protein 17 isoform X2 [Synchiropus splendidus]|uniref:RING finger protein 17 isoform X2 n=1 Tax=Synchiropus splendidus TaxID=270530 RepID=UPI00237DE4DA|nr:RING finger protein 17 isoform X2 [Synchiropus splendidus]
MERRRSSGGVLCKSCGQQFTLPEDGVEGNLPRTLVCSHTFCTRCLLSIQCTGVILCPECEVGSVLPEGGVLGLQEDTGIIGLIYISKIDKKRIEKQVIQELSDANNNTENTEWEPVKDKTAVGLVDEALAKAVETHAQLMKIQEKLRMGLDKQLRRETVRLTTDIRLIAAKAIKAIRKWEDEQFNQLANLESYFAVSQSQAELVHHKIMSLESAMQKAMELRRHPAMMEKHDSFEKMLKPLLDWDPQCFDLNCLNLDSGLRFVFRSEGQDACLLLTLRLEASNPKILPESPCQQYGVAEKKYMSHCASVRDDGNERNKQIASSKKRPLSLESSSSPQPESPQGSERSSVSLSGSALNLTNPDVIIEEITEQLNNPTPIVTEPEQTIQKNAPIRKTFKRKGKRSLLNKDNVPQWVTVSHIVSPSHFYISYVSETKEHVKLSRIINNICKKTDSCFSSTDSVEKESTIFAKRNKELWCRAVVMEVYRRGHSGVVDACPVTLLAAVQVYFLDYGSTVSLQPKSDKWTLKELNTQMKKMDDEVKLELSRFAPQAVRCCLKNIVPNNPTEGWSNDAQEMFVNLVGCSVVQMRPLGQDRESLLVDLRKNPTDLATAGPVSVREYLVLSDLAWFYSPMVTGPEVLRFYPPVIPSINQEYNAVVSHINTPDDFHIQLVDNMEYYLMSAKLQDCYSVTSGVEDASLIIFCPVIGQACVAQYEDDLWYRAQVIGHSEDEKVDVKYVDFGNTKSVFVTSLRMIKEEFFSLPSMAIHCCLSDIVPMDGKAWSEACSNRFKSFAQKLVTIVITEKVPNNRPHPVQLFEGDQKSQQSSIADILVNEDLACFRENFHCRSAMDACDPFTVWDTPLDCSTPKTFEVNDEANDKEQDKNNSVFEPCLQFPQELSDIKVRVSHVVSPSSFYVQFAEVDHQLKRLGEVLKQECELTELTDTEWKEDMFCAAYINNIWHRVQILSDVPSTGIARVIRCDHGNKAEVHISNLRPLPSSLLGSYALECALTDIRPTGGVASWTATACDFISYFLTGASARITIEEATDKRPVPVTLSCFNKSERLVKISDVLASEGLALRVKKPLSGKCAIQKPNDETTRGGLRAEGSDSNTTCVPVPTVRSHAPKPARRLTVSAEKVTTGLYLPPMLPSIGHMEAVVCAVSEDGLIYTWSKNAELDLGELRDRIQQLIKSPLQANVYTWKSVQGCAVIGSDMVWYRGQVMEVVGGHLKVRYVDYGLVEDIPMVHAHPVLLCANVPQLCVPCQLHDVNLVGGQWQWETIQLMRELLQNRPVDINVLGLPADPRAPVTIEVFLDGQRLSRILMNHREACVTVSVQTGISGLSVAPSLRDWSIDVENLKVRDEKIFRPFISPALPPLNSCFQVAVKHLLTPNEMYLWPMEGGGTELRVDGETLEDALNRINENIDALPRATCLHEEAQCLAEYSDGRYYRARLIRVVSVEPVMVMVQHVDFGSDDTLPLSKLRQMPAELSQFPLQVIKVRVASLKPPSVQEEEAVLPYSPQWSLKAAKAMTDLLHGRISASVVSVEPELTVELYNNEGHLVHLPLVSCGLADLD